MTLPRLIACDVDGTLFDDDERITPRTRAAVRAAVAARRGGSARWSTRWASRRSRCAPTAR